MGIRTRGLDIKVGARRHAADKAARAEAEGLGIAESIESASK
jgi:hypothetical protein